MATLQDYILDPEQLSKIVYNYWIQLLKTDKVQGHETMATWYDLDDDCKQDFIESVRINITDIITKFVVDVNEQSMRSSRGGEGAWCYSCGSNNVPSAGKMCAICHKSHAYRGENG